MPWQGRSGAGRRLTEVGLSPGLLGLLRAGDPHYCVGGLDAGRWVLSLVSSSAHLVAHCTKGEAAGAKCLGGVQTLVSPGLPWALRPAPAPWPPHPAPLTRPPGDSWRTLVSNCCFRTSPPELSPTRRLGSVTSGVSGPHNWAETLQRRAPAGPRIPRPRETRP